MTDSLADRLEAIFTTGVPESYFRPDELATGREAAEALRDYETLRLSYIELDKMIDAGEVSIGMTKDEFRKAYMNYKRGTDE